MVFINLICHDFLQEPLKAFLAQMLSWVEVASVTLTLL